MKSRSLIGLLLAGLLLTASSVHADDRHDDRPPNIVWIIPDDTSANFSNIALMKKWAAEGK